MAVAASTKVSFRYEGPATSVRVRGGIESLGDTEMRRAGDAWVVELDAPSNLRTVYWFALDGEEDWARWLPDPSNPKRYVYPPGLEFTGEHEVVASLLELPDVPPRHWSVERDVPHGTLEERELDGRRVWLYTPPVQAEALLLLFDGDAFTRLAPAQVVLDNLIAAGEIPPTAAVLPDSLDTKSRFRDLGCSPRFLAWACDVLLPWSGFSAPRECTVVAGASMGGLAATYFAAERPELFGNAIVQSAGFAGEQVTVPPGLAVRWYLDVGVLEHELLGATHALRDHLRDSGYEVAYQEYPGRSRLLLVAGNDRGRPPRAAPSGTSVKMLPW